MSRRYFLCLCERALLRYRSSGFPVFTFAPSLDVLRRIARERVPTIPRHVSSVSNILPDQKSGGLVGRCSFTWIFGRNGRILVDLENSPLRE